MRSLLLSLSLYLCSLIPSLLAPPKEAKIESQNSKQPSNTQVCDTWVSHRNWQISDFLPLRGKSKPCVPRKKKAPQWSIHTTKKAPPSASIWEKLPNHLLLHSHFPSRATTPKAGLSIDTGVVQRDEGERGRGRTIHGLFNGLPRLTWIRG